MLISDSHKFIFFHYPKTAGTSMTFSLAPFVRDFDKLPKNLHHKMVNHPLSCQTEEWIIWAGENAILDAIDKEPEDKGNPFVDIELYHEDIRKYCPMRDSKFFWEGLDYIKVMFIRNPYELIFSIWSGILDFDDFIETEIECGLKEDVKWNQIDYMTDYDGTLLVDFIGRYENLESDWKKFTSIIGEDLKLPALNVGGDGMSGSAKPKTPCEDCLLDIWEDEGPGPKSPLYTNYYTPYSRSVVEHFFKEDLYYFDYEYGK
tara:strand:+ start:115 stop:894 length:780 start_codon:yes stop_codon:yes gene_type:complete